MRTLEELVEMLAELLDLFGWDILTPEDKDYIYRIADRDGEYTKKEIANIERLHKKYKKGSK